MEAVCNTVNTGHLSSEDGVYLSPFIVSTCLLVGRMFVCMYVPTYVYMYVCMYVCLYVFIHISVYAVVSFSLHCCVGPPKEVTCCGH